MALTRDQILEASDLKTATVEVPEWNGSVIVRTMTGADRNAYEASMVKIAADGTRTTDMANHRAKLVAVTAVDEAGNLLFTADEIERLASKSAAALEKVFDAAVALNGLGAKSEAEAAKN